MCHQAVSVAIREIAIQKVAIEVEKSQLRWNSSGRRQIACYFSFLIMMDRMDVQCKKTSSLGISRNPASSYQNLLWHTQHCSVFAEAKETRLLDRALSEFQTALLYASAECCGDNLVEALYAKLGKVTAGILSSNVGET